MYGNNPFYNSQFSVPYYSQDMNKLHQPTSINQTFQLNPNQNVMRFVNNIDDVKNTLVFGDTFFIDKDFTTLWRKDATGQIKTYTLEEVIEQDDKDRKISELEAKIEALEKEMSKNEPTSNASSSSTVTTNT